MGRKRDEKKKRKKLVGYWTRLIAEKRVRAEDDWCPTYPDGTVQVRLSESRHTEVDKKTKELRVTSEEVHISIFGADDFGMEKCGSLSDMQQVYDTLPDPISIPWAYSHGFT